MTTTTTATSSRLSALSEAWDAYLQALEANPLLVKSVTAGVLLGAADLAGQAVEQAKKEKEQEEIVGYDSTAAEAASIDWPRSLRFATFGLVLQAPWNHFYYQVCASRISSSSRLAALPHRLA